MLSDLSFSHNRLSCNFLNLSQKISLTETETYHDRCRACLCGRKASLRASLTVEAALAAPLFAFFLLSILYLFQLELLEMQVREALYDTAQQMAAVSFLPSGEDADTAAVFAYAGAGSINGTVQIGSQIQQQPLLRLVVGGKAGIVCTQEDPKGEDVVLSARALVRLPLGLFPNHTFTLSETARVRKWNGYDPSEEAPEGMCYVTANGEVIHKDRNCAYLNPSTHAVSRAQVKLERNASGEKYEKCPVCGNWQTDGACYVTDYGTVYHTSLQCSGLKRTIYVIPEEEAGSLRYCSKCGEGPDEDGHGH